MDNDEYRPHLPKAPKAYESPNFMNSRDARPLRIMSEYVYPEQVFRKHKVRNTIVFFGSARIQSRKQFEDKKRSLEVLCEKTTGAGQEAIQKELASLVHKAPLIRYYEEARELSQRITEWSLQFPREKQFIVCSGGGPGIMEAANRGAHDAGGESIGLSISLPHEQRPNAWISPKFNLEFHYFYMRKLWFMYFAKVLVVFPGGYGTLDELFELLTLVQTQKIDKPLKIMIYGKDFWNSIVNFDKLAEYGVISPEDVDLFELVDTVDDAYEFLTTHLPLMLT